VICKKKQSYLGAVKSPKTLCIVRKRQKTVFMQIVPDVWSEKHVCVLWKIEK
jgi:hypothetical protein